VRSVTRSGVMVVRTLGCLLSSPGRRSDLWGMLRSFEELMNVVVQAAFVWEVFGCVLCKLVAAWILGGLRHEWEETDFVCCNLYRTDTSLFLRLQDVRFQTQVSIFGVSFFVSSITFDKALRVWKGNSHSPLPSALIRTSASDSKLHQTPHPTKSSQSTSKLKPGVFLSPIEDPHSSSL